MPVCPIRFNGGNVRRKEREITEKSELDTILEKGRICRIAMSNDGAPYMVPVCYGFRPGRLYFHCAREGTKLDIIAKHPMVCFEVETDVEVIKRESPCKWGLRYKSVVGYGSASVVEDPEEVREGLTAIMQMMSGETAFEFSEEAMKKIHVVRIVIDRLTGKQS